MRKLILIFMFMSFTSSAHAVTPDRIGRVDVGVNLSGAFSTDGDVDSSYYIGGNVSYGIYEWLAVGMSTGWTEGDAESSLSNGQEIESGDFRTIPLLVDFYFRWYRREEPYVPYGVVGLGVMFHRFDENEDLAGRGIDIDDESGFGARLGLGLDWFVNDSWIVNVETSYFFSSTDLDSDSTSSVIAEGPDTDYWLVGGGVKYLFN
jgi:outer membrane protein W